MLCQCKLL